MTDSASNSPSVPNSSRKPLQKPVFIIEPFNPSNIEHMKGNMTLVLNKRLATDLCRLLRECDLSQDEGYFFAIQGNIQRWYMNRFEEIKRTKASQTPVLVENDLKNTQ